MPDDQPNTTHISLTRDETREIMRWACALESEFGEATDHDEAALLVKLSGFAYPSTHTQRTVGPDRRHKPFGPEHVPRLAKARREAGSAILYERVAEAYEFEWQELLDRIYLAMREADERAGR